MSRRTLRRALVAAVVAALAAPVAADAKVTLRGVDAGAYPTLRVTLVSPTTGSAPPTLTENGRPVVDLRAANLAAAKSIVLAIDRSRSMAGTKLADALDAARQFLHTKAASDRVAVVAFGSKAQQLSPFSSSTADANDALGTLAIDKRSGTALYDALQLSAGLLGSQSDRSHVVVLLTDGRDFSSSTSLEQAVATASKNGALVYAVAIGGSSATTAPLRRIAAQTGGSFRSAATSSQLGSVYASIANELKRTWRLEYATAARPGDHLHLRVSLNPEGAVTTDFTVPGTARAPSSSGDQLPSPLYSSLGGLLLTLLVAFLVLTACGFVFASVKGSWVKTRIAPHVEGQRTSRKRQKGERLAALGGLFRATEEAFGHRRVWRALHRKLERADLPLRTVEFAYLIVGCAFLVALLAALSGSSSLVILLGFVVGAALPYGFVAFKAKRRMNAFDDQLPDLLVTLAASLKAGHSFKQGIQTVVDEGQEPASKELSRVITDTRLGRPMDEALAETAERIGSKNFSFVITAVTIQRQVGGSLANLFDMVAETVRQRQQFARKIKALTAMGRASAYVLVGLPFFIALALTLLNPSYMQPLYATSTGHLLIILGLVMIAFGSLILKKLVSFRG